MVDSRPSVPVDNEFLVEAFRAVTDESGSTVYVPEKMTRTRNGEGTESQNLTETLILQEVRLGREVEGHIFQPKLPPAVPVFAVDDDRGKLQWQNLLNSTRKNGAKPVVLEVPTATAPTAVAAAHKPVLVAEPDGGWSWSITLLVVGIVLVVLATWKFRR